MKVHNVQAVGTYYGHLKRMPEEGMPELALDWVPSAEEGEGRHLGKR